MSKSIDRVMDALKAANCAALAMEMPAETRTAAQAADAASCDIDQIAKSIIFAGETTGDLYLFITAGGNQVCEAKAAILTGEALGRAHPGVVREKTGFAIGGIPRWAPLPDHVIYGHAPKRFRHRLRRSRHTTAYLWH